MSLTNKTVSAFLNLIPINNSNSTLTFPSRDNSLENSSYEIDGFSPDAPPARTRDEDLAKLEVGLLACIFLVTVIGNFIVIMGIYFRRQKMTRMYYFILHLSLADLITAFFNVGTQFVMELTWPEFLGGNVFCKVVKYLQILGPYSSSYVLIMTALDRYQAICYPMSNCNWTAKQSKFMLGLAWGIAILFCVPQIFVFSLQELAPDSYDCWATFPPEWGAKLYVTWYALSSFIIPLLVLIFAYTCICRAIWLNISMKNTALRMEAPRRYHSKNSSIRDTTADMESTATSMVNGNSPPSKQDKDLYLNLKRTLSTKSVLKERKIESETEICQYPILGQSENVNGNGSGNQSNRNLRKMKETMKDLSPIENKYNYNDNDMDESESSSSPPSENYRDAFHSINVKYNYNYNGDRNDGESQTRKKQNGTNCPIVTSQIETKYKYRWSTAGCKKNNKNEENSDADAKTCTDRSGNVVDNNSKGSTKQLLLLQGTKFNNTNVQILTRASTSPGFFKTTIGPQPRTHSVKGISRAKIKTVKLTVTVIVCYIICSSPFIAAQLWVTYDPLAHQSSFYTGTVFTVLTLLASLNSCANPWIFLCFNPNLLHDFLRGCRSRGNKFTFSRNRSATSQATRTTLGPFRD